MLLYINIYYIMPKTKVDYSKTVIYKIVCNDENIEYLYVGSTTDFTKRKYTHKCCCNNETNEEYNQNKYIQMRNNGGWDNFKMLEVEKYPCNDNREAEAREEEIRVKLKANMNSYRCFVTEEQKKDSKNEYSKEYRETNKDKIKEYSETNKEKVKEQRNEKFVCPCGCIFNYGNKSRHFKSAKHKNFLEIQNYIIEENYIKTDNKKDIIPLKEIYNIFKDSEIYINSTKEQKRKMNYKNFIEKIKNNIFFRSYLKIKNDTYYLINYILNEKKIEDDLNEITN